MYLEILQRNKGIKKSTSLLINIVSSSILALLTNFLFQLFQAFWSFSSVICWIRQHSATFFIGSFFIFFIYTFTLSLFGNLYLSSFLCICVFVAIGFSNINKLTILGEPLYPVDFYQIRYINSLFKMIGGKISLFTIIICVISIATFAWTVKKLPKLPMNILIRVFLLLISAFMIYSFGNFNESIVKSPVSKSGVSVVLWNQPYNYNTNGFVFGMLSNLQTEVMEEPEDYTEETIKRIAEKYTKEAQVVNSKLSNSINNIHPNIVFVMDETFWDPTEFSSLCFSEDPMKNIREIMNYSSSGRMLSPEFGGNTANVEFEALTGLSMYNLIPGSIPYQQTLDKDGLFPSLISMLEDKQYDTVALHPYNKTFYKRNRVYNYLGFNEFIGEEELTYKDYLSKDSYVSDQSVVSEILDKLKEKDKPLFIHAVTMQNHTPLFDNKYGLNSISIDGLSDANTKELETYVEGINKTDKAIKNLIDNISKLDEPTLVVFWGDHLPVLSNSIYEEAKYTFDNPLESQRALSETPLFIYSNFDLEKRNLNTLSPSFLGVTLYDLLEIPLSPYYTMLEKIKSFSPGLKASVLIDTDGNIKEQLTKEEENILNDYKLIQYDLMVGKQYSLPLLFK